MMRALLAAWFCILPAIWAAPKDSSGRPENSQDSVEQLILNLLHPDQDSLRQLQDYLENIGHVNGATSAMTREQALLLLFALHDYDKNGQLDGLEFMRLLNELASQSQQAKGQPVTDLVVPMVDSILETQDFNWDGLLEPSELFLPPRQGQNPNFLTAPSEDGTILKSTPRLNGQAIDLSSHLDHQGTRGPPVAPEAVQEQEARKEIWSSQKQEGELGQEAAGDMFQQGEEIPSTPGD